jgi:hypothetical protein
MLSPGHLFVCYQTTILHELKNRVVVDPPFGTYTPLRTMRFHKLSRPLDMSSVIYWEPRLSSRELTAHEGA